MSLGVSYMGTKRRLSGLVKRLVADCQQGPLLDAFSGMCAVGSAVAPSRQIWTSDTQVFANTVAEAYFCSQCLPMGALAAGASGFQSFHENRSALLHLYADKVAMEAKALDACDAKQLKNLFEECIEKAQLITSGTGKAACYDLFSSRYAGTYFGFLQSIEIDSIRYAADVLRADGVVSDDQHRWLVLALCVAMSKCSTTTGHFAQPLTPKDQNIKKIVAQRRRSVWDEWLHATNALIPVGSKRWRKKNKVYHGDALDLLSVLAKETKRPSVVYADPPYTADQYSRYYHLYETLVLYDYPSCSGRGLYRDGRAVSGFSLSSRVESSISSLIAKCAEMECDIVLSYPTDGLLNNSCSQIPDLLSRHYGGKHIDVWEIPHVHSTMGASKGIVRSTVTEVIYRVQCS